MGGCLNKSGSNNIVASSKQEGDHGDVVLKKVTNSQQDIVFLADVYLVSSKENPQKWQSIFQRVVPVSLLCIKQGEVYSYRISAPGREGTSFRTYVHVPGTNFRKTSTCFVQWRDTDESGWGLNFISESEATKFLNECSPPSLTPQSQRMRHDYSTLSLSLPIPEPLTITDVTQLNTSLIDSEMENKLSQAAHSILAVGDSLPESPVSNGERPLSLSSSIVGDSDETDSGPLFEPSSPHRLFPTDFILMDIEEESEDMLSTSETIEKESRDFSLEDQEGLQEPNSSYDVEETVFHGSAEDPDREEAYRAEPYLPVSPPPGPLLSPRYSMLLAALEESKNTSSDEVSSLNRLSTFSMADDEPPPLPQSQPPGKTMSPKHSASTLQSQGTENSALELGDLLSRLATLYEGKRTKLLDTREPEEDISGTNKQMLSFPDSAGTDYTDEHLESEKQSPIIDPPEKFICTESEKNSGVTYDTGIPNLKKDSVVSATSSSDLEPSEWDSSSVTQSFNGDTASSIQGTAANAQFQAESNTSKTGWLQAKQVLSCRNKKNNGAMKVKGRWRKYWVELKQLRLFLYQCDEEQTVGTKVSFILNLNLCLANPVYDDIRRDNVFCVATVNGNVYYIQALDHSNLSEWITAMHCAAGISVSGKFERQECIDNLEVKINDLYSSIEKLKELRIKTITKKSNETEKSHQVLIYSDAIELLSVDLYRLRSYIASLRGTEQPNPETVMSCVTKQTKQELLRVGMFSVSTVTALINSKQGLLLSSEEQKVESDMLKPRTKSSAVKGQGSQKSLRSMGISDPLPIIKPKLLPFSSSGVSVERKKESGYYSVDSINFSQDGSKIVTVKVPNGENTQYFVQKDMTVAELCSKVCQEHHLDENDHYLRLSIVMNNEKFGVIPYRGDTFGDVVCTSAEVCQKSMHTAVVRSTENSTGIEGLQLAPVWAENGSDLRYLSVQEIDSECLPQNQSLHTGDEIMSMDDISVTELGWSQAQHLMNSASILSLTVRTCLLNAPVSCDALVSDVEFSLTKRFQHSWKIEGPSEENVKWSRDKKLQKSAMDLCETEAEFIKSLEVLVDEYIHPLKTDRGIISDEEVQLLCGDIIEVVNAQKSLFSHLKESVFCLGERESPEISQQTVLKNMVKEIARVFLSREDHFRRYSTFCASCQKAKELSGQAENHQWNTFLEGANPHHSSQRSLDYLLTKPIVRISRYPLFLSAIQENTDENSEEKETMSEAIKLMSAIANHINEIQRVCENYQNQFESLMTSSTLNKAQLRVHVSELKYYGEAKWLNPTVESLKKGLRKGEGPLMMLFVFETAIVVLLPDKRQGTKGKESHSVDEVSYKALLPCAHCMLQDLPNSDGVSNMWQIHFMPKDGEAGCNYLFRNKSASEKLVLFGWIEHVCTSLSHSITSF